MFDADSFMHATITEVNSTRVKPWPVGDYPATIKEVKASSGTIGKGDKAGQPWARLDVVCTVTDPSGAARETTGLEQKDIRAGVMLDLTEDGRGLDMSEGKNLRLGRLREAANMNQPGAPFSPAMLVGQSVRVKVGHRPDQNDASTIYDEVTAFAKG